MKYVNWLLVKKYIEENLPVTERDLFGYNSIYDFYYYQLSMILPSGDKYTYKFNDFDVTSYSLPNFKDLPENMKLTF